MAAASSLGVGEKWKKPLGEAPPAALVLSNGDLASSYVRFANPNSTKSALSEIPGGEHLVVDLWPVRSGGTSEVAAIDRGCGSRRLHRCVWRCAVDGEESTFGRGPSVRLDSPGPCAERGIVDLGRPRHALQHGVRCRSNLCRRRSQRGLVGLLPDNRRRVRDALRVRVARSQCEVRMGGLAARRTATCVGVLVHLVGSAVHDPDVLAPIRWINGQTRGLLVSGVDRPASQIAAAKRVLEDFVGRSCR